MGISRDIDLAVRFYRAIVCEHDFDGANKYGLAIEYGKAGDINENHLLSNVIRRWSCGCV
jgi:hypothetical protein